MKANRKILFVVNPISGVKGKKAAIELLKTELNSEIEYKIVETQRADHATELSKAAKKEGYNAVIAVGGDGTVNGYFAVWLGKWLCSTSQDSNGNKRCNSAH